MAHSRVRPRLDELMIDLERDPRAPELPNMPARPDSEAIPVATSTIAAALIQSLSGTHRRLRIPRLLALREKMEKAATTGIAAVANRQVAASICWVR